jgi:hypothetical protein
MEADFRTEDPGHLYRLSPEREAGIYGGMRTMTEFNLDETVAVLARTPATLDAMLRGLPERWVRSNEGKDTWSAFDIVGHLIVGERTDWMTRVRVILESGEARPFNPSLTALRSRKRVKASRWSSSLTISPACAEKIWPRCRR